MVRIITNIADLKYIRELIQVLQLENLPLNDFGAVLERLLIDI